MNCTGKRCLMQYNKVDPATCTAVSYCPQATPPKTNADRIRSMTDEKLAEWIVNLDCEPTEECATKNCKECVLDWLRSEADE